MPLIVIFQRAALEPAKIIDVDFCHKMLGGSCCISQPCLQLGTNQFSLRRAIIDRLHNLRFDLIYRSNIRS
jgi:hypothetical protein